MSRIAILVFVSLSCGAAAFGQQHQPEYVYVSNGGLDQFLVNKGTGVLTAVPGAPSSLNGAPIAAAPKGQFVFFADPNPASLGVSVGKIDRGTGLLTAVPGSPFAADVRVTSLAVTPNERFLIAAAGPSIYTFTIDGDAGALTPAGPPVVLPYAATGLAVTPSSAFLYVCSNYVYGYSINSHTGVLTSIGGNVPGATASVISVDGKYLYTVSANDTNSFIGAYAVDAASGALTAVPGSPFAGAAGGLTRVAIDPTGRFLYQAVVTAQNAFNGITGFLINSLNGALEGVVPGAPFATAGVPSSMAIDHSGKFLYAPGEFANILNEFTVNTTTGSITVIPGTPPVITAFGYIVLTAPRPASSATLVSLSIEPVDPSVDLTATSTEQLTASGTYSDGTHRFLTASVQWNSSNPIVATISNSPGQSGLATVLGNGQTVIEASLGGLSARTTLTVQMSELVSIAVTPISPAVKAGTAIQLTATGTYGDGTTKDLTNAVAWISSNASVAPINQSGFAYGRSAGTSTMSAVSGTVTGSTVLTVTAR